MQTLPESHSELLWLLDSAPSRRHAKSMPDTPQRWLPRFIESRPSWQIGVVLSGIGIGLIAASLAPWPWLEHYHAKEITAAIGEAVLIAGLLALLVDPFLKARLLREASRNVFEHMLGFDHEPELRAKLRGIVFDTKLYRKDFRLDCTIDGLHEDGMVGVSLTAEFEVFNPSQNKEKYEAPWAFVEVEQPSGYEVVRIVGDKEPEVLRRDFVAGKPGYLEAKIEPIEVECKSRGVRYRFTSKCRCRGQQDWYHTIYFGIPTIDVQVSVKAPDGWTVWVGGQRDQQMNQARFHDQNLYMPGDKVEIHWRKPPV